MKTRAEARQVDRHKVFGEANNEIERIAPGFFGDQIEAEHLARYHWASTMVSGKTVLDAACGTGYGTRMLRDAGATSAIGVDLHVPALAFGRSEYGSVVVGGSVECIPLRDGCADVVVSMETIEHLAEPSALLREAHRVLRPGGLMLVSTPNGATSSGTNPYHLHEMTIDELAEALDHSGFNVQSVSGQCWRLRTWGRGVWGIRHFIWKAEHDARVRPQPFGRTEPVFWVVSASRR